MNLVKSSNFWCEKSSGKSTNYGSLFWVRIPPKSLTPLRFSAIISPYNRILFHPLRIFFRQTPPTCLRLTNKLKKQSILTLIFSKFIMKTFKVEGDLGRHFLSIRGASDECGISTSSINRMVERGTYPPKVNITSKRIGFLVYQVEEWLQGKRGDWA